MGTDIHIWVERMPKHNPTIWLPTTVQDCAVPRDYTLFNYLNGEIRWSHRDPKPEALTSGRKWPADISDSTAKSLEVSTAAHGFTWLMEVEFKRAFPWSWETLNDLHYKYFALIVYAEILPWNDQYTSRILLAFDC